ncbi:uncharacterized protein LOC113522915 [Galleria mellonella]|uniref:Small RNA 2'-O-methyltransferase n=1 Tax=Galleria mellonella TaxID=7137 RepID=A0ABM3MTC0_GALME|nr:uncharacterized protein LOC113522915 [Galleria mellonella]
MIIALQALIFFRESLLTAINRLLRPYYKHFLSLNRDENTSDNEDFEDHVFAEFDDEKGVVFYPPVYAQRYAAVSDCLMDERWCGKLEKVVDLGYHDISFIKYLKEVPGIKCILGVDIESIPLRCSSDIFAIDEYSLKREKPLQVILFQGNAADPDYRLIGCDAVVAIEMIEHMLPHDLERLVHTVFGFIKPWIAVFTTPNSDFNVLFKALEKNGLRRLDHFFEWSREQFHDWCSNIVSRYPQYTVSCKGVGPGPPGTLHYGCCSQLAVFISKEYHKQQDLNLNSLALVANAPKYNDASDMIGTWEYPGSPESQTKNKMLCLPNSSESITELVFSEQSCITILISPSFSMASLEYRDKILQCNLDFEVGRNFLMFDDEMYFNVLVPRRKLANRVYVIEDVTSRLNCTTLQVKKFSKTTQNMMLKNRFDSIVHTRQVVDEIQHLTKMLNFDKESINKEHNGTWCNINWGDNAPYWNQYYKVVREYNYPFENKSEECRILDLISEEMNRLIDIQYDEECSLDVNKFEIPIDQLMRVVEHITDDVDRVKDLLEWNGYEVVGDTVIHSRIVVDSGSVPTHDDDWQDNDTFSDWGTTEVHSTSLSDGSTVAADYHGWCLRRALDHKVRKLRSMLSADEDIASELDRVVCRLMKLALCTSRGHQAPPPPRWMQCKLLDLLTLTEKAIERRKKHFIDNYPLKAIDYDYQKTKTEKMLTLTKFVQDDSAKALMDKYRHLVESNEAKRKEQDVNNYVYLNDDLSITNNEYLKEFDFVDDSINSPSLVDIASVVNRSVNNKLFATFNKEETKLQRTQAWVDDDVEIVPCPNHDTVVVISSGGDTDHSFPNTVRFKVKKLHKRQKKYNFKNSYESNGKCSKGIVSNKQHKQNKERKNKIRDKTNKMKLTKKAPKDKSSYRNLTKSYNNEVFSTDLSGFKTKSKRKIKEHSKLQSNISKPIPGSLVKLCNPESTKEKDMSEIQYLTVDDRSISPFIINDDIICENVKISATEESLLIDIVMDNMEETIALRRTIGSDADEALVNLERDTVLGNLAKVLNDDNSYYKPKVFTENSNSQTIFLYDINEPSTSKGVRHVNMDVQCGPDTTAPVCSMSSTTTSCTRIPKIFTTGIKIDDSTTNIPTQNSFGCGTSIYDYDDHYRTISPTTKSIGIKIKNSDLIISEKVECATMTNNIITKNFLCTGTKLIKCMSSGLDEEESMSEFYKKFDSSKSCFKSTSEIHIKSSMSNKVIADHKYCTGSVQPKLCTSGVHVHSYRDTQVSEDVIYQGKWQRCRPKVLTKKRNICNIITGKKVSGTLNSFKKIKTDSKEKIHDNVIKSMIDRKKPKKELGKLKLPVSNNTMKYNKNVIKIPSKLTFNCPSKNVKSAFMYKIHTPISAKKESENVTKKKIYIPKYLKRNFITQNKLVTETNRLKQSIDIVNKVLKNYKEKPVGQVTPLVRSKTEDINKDLLKFTDMPRNDINYIVFRNEIDTKNADCESPSTTNKNIKMKDSGNKINHSPKSQNSSTCSSPSSIATVRVASTRPNIFSSRRYSVSSNKINLSNSESDMNILKNKKYKKKYKAVKKIEHKDLDNKENIPESSIDYKKINKENTNKSVYRAQLMTEKLSLQNIVNSLSKHKAQSPKKPNVTMRKSEGTGNKLISPFVSEKSLKSELTNNKEEEIIADNVMTTSNSVDSSDTKFISPSVKTFRTNYEVDCPSQVVTRYNSIFSDMRRIIEESLNFENRYVSACNDPMDSEAIILRGEDIYNTSLVESSSPASFKTVITNEDLNISIQSDLNNVTYQTFDSILDEASIIAASDMELTDLDFLSFKSITSASKNSEYFLAADEFDNTRNQNESSVQNIFERKNQLVTQNPAGALILQAFSGFSVNAEPVAGDRPDRVNFIDSETGSIALEVARQVASEEVFISGRSSASYESCIIDDETILPYWLFHISQESVDDEEPIQPPLEQPLALPEPMFDTNGNALPGVGAGAGDGHGMHSDLSQDSSEQGTSHSSTDTSSGVQSEVILIDPSAFTAQLELLRGTTENSLVPIVQIPAEEMPDVSFVIIEGRASDPVNLDEGRNPVVSLLAASDVEADISSFDTDVPDSSDN